MRLAARYLRSGEYRLSSAVSIRAHSVQNVTTEAFNIHSKISQNEAGHTFLFQQQTQENMLGMNEGMPHSVHLPRREPQGAFGARRVRDITRRVTCRAR